MLLADVSGHGSIVSEQAIGLLNLMRRNVNYIKQTRFVRTMNRQFTQLNEQGGFATAVVVTYFAPSNSLTVSNAGHPPPFVYRARESSWRLIRHEAPDSDRITDTPLGIVDQAVYRQTESKLAENDMVLCYSDAFNEAKGPDGKMLGTAGLLQLVRQLDMQHSDSIVKELITAVSQLHPGNLQQDDTTVLLLRATKTRTRLADNLLAPFRLLARAADHTNLSFPRTDKSG
jgi:serine phosphatase RsbU (regulator of sigma subunit)